MSWTAQYEPISVIPVKASSFPFSKVRRSIHQSHFIENYWQICKVFAEIAKTYNEVVCPHIWNFLHDYQRYLDGVSCILEWNDCVTWETYELGNCMTETVLYLSLKT